MNIDMERKEVKSLTINDIIKKYKLNTDECWQLPQNKKLWIISHMAIEKIIAIENIEIVDIDIINSDWDFCRLKVIAEKTIINDYDKRITKRVITIGEALLNNGNLDKLTKYGKPITKGNCESQYIGCMAEKRGIDRAVLKLINAYELGMYSDSESEEFENNNKQVEPEKKQPESQADNKKDYYIKIGQLVTATFENTSLFNATEKAQYKRSVDAIINNEEELKKMFESVEFEHNKRMNYYQSQKKGV